jgi:HEPN domain-containing protein
MKAQPIQQWLDRAAEDLTVARLVFKEAHFSHACFLAQQCVEKSLKGFLLARKNDYPRAHKLTDLITQCIALDSAFSRFRDSCIVIDQYYIPTRYPNGVPGGMAEGLPGRQEAEEAITYAESIMNFTLSQF